MPVTANSSVLHIDRDSLLQLDRSMTREWLETDGRGGYASSTVLMCPTRRYHGLLVAPLPGSPRGIADRHVFLSRFEETLHGGGKSMPISMARYPGLWSPHGHQTIESFDLRPWPAFLYLFGSARIERDVLMAKSTAAVLVRYRVSGQRSAVELALRPLLPFRSAGALTYENMALDPRTERTARGIRCRPYAEMPELHLVVAGAAPRFEADPVWYRRLEYPADAARGYEGNEDQFSPGVLRIPLEDGHEIFVAASLDGPVEHADRLWERETSARQAALPLASGTISARDASRMVADDFLVRTEQRRLTVAAGYPWFGDWGRDLFVSLPGLLLARGRAEECRAALEGALPFLRRGLMPNVFGARPEDSDYGSIDASLWFARAVRLLELASPGTAGRFLPALEEIARSYLAGTDLGIRCDEGGLVQGGSPESNATWMDARTAEGPVTPRDGCAVEVEALWYFLLAYLEDLHERGGNASRASDWGAQKRLAGMTFLERFVLPEGYLADSWKDGQADRAMRPNMVIAAALEWSPLTRPHRAAIVRAAETELLVPCCGLRTLEPRDPRYVGRYAGGPEQRDRAYHQGTAWPWLLGFFCEAALRAHGRDPQQIARLRGLLEAFDGQMAADGLLHVSEVFDGDPPHKAGGTIAQAWNTGELLRAWSLLDEPGTPGSRAGGVGG